MVKALDNVPYNERQWGHWLATNLINTKQKLGLSVSKKLEKPSSEENWQQQLADELHKPIKRNFIRQLIIANGIDKIWSSDLVEKQQFSKWNKGYRYLLMILDLSPNIAFKTIFEEGRKLQYLWTDKGKEIYDKNLKDLLQKHNITLYSTENEEKSSVCKRWNRTIKTKM